MSTVASPARGAHPRAPRPGEWLATDLAPLAAEIVGTLRDYDLADVHQVLAAVPDGQRTDLILVLAAMVDVDRTPGELLEWTGAPVKSRDDGSVPPPSKSRAACHLCGKVMRRDKLGRHQRNMHAEQVAA